MLIVSHLGILSELLESSDKILANIKDWHGCSCGSAVAYFGILGVSPGWIRELMDSFQLQVMGRFQDECITNFFDRWGVCDGTIQMDYFARIIDTWEPGASQWTFADLAAKRPGQTLTIIATNLTRQCQARFDAVRTPHVRILDAIRASSAIPLFFTPWVDASGDVFCDGAIIETQPWSYISRKERDTTLFISCNAKSLTMKGVYSPVRTLSDYMSALMNSIKKVRTKDTIPSFWIAVESSQEMTLDFAMSKEVQWEFFRKGVAAVRGWLAWRRLMPAAGSATQQSHSLSCHPSTLSVLDQASLEKTQDSPPPGKGPLLPCHLRSQIEPRRFDRRWSL